MAGHSKKTNRSFILNSMLQSYLEMNKQQFKSFVQLPMDTSVVMLNMLKFKDIVSETELSGMETYKEYTRQAQPFLAMAEAEVIFLGTPQIMLIGPEDKDLWDKVLLVKYKTIKGFLDMIQAEGYPAHLRAQALEDSRLIHCKTSF